MAGGGDAVESSRHRLHDRPGTRGSPWTPPNGPALEGVTAPQLALTEAGRRGAFEANEHTRHLPQARATTPGCATRLAAAEAVPVRGAARP